MKKFNYIIGSLIYLAVWLYNAFKIGMSHSVPYYKYEQTINQYYFVIIILELLTYIFMVSLLKRPEGDKEAGWPFLIGLLLYALLPWEIIQFTQYGHGYRWLEKIGINETVMVLFVNLLPLVLLHLTIAFGEKIGKRIFGRFIRNKNANQ